MGAWGHGPFDSDGGLDELEDLVDYTGVEADDDGEYGEIPEKAMKEFAASLSQRLRSRVFDRESEVYACIGMIAAKLGNHSEKNTGTSLLVHAAASQGSTDAAEELAADPIGLDAHTGHLAFLTLDDAKALAPAAAQAVDRLLDSEDWLSSWDEPNEVTTRLGRLHALLSI